MKKVLVINCGSSSIKYEVFEMPEGRSLADGLVERIGEPDGRLTHRAAGRETAADRPVQTHQEGLAMVLEALTGGADPVVRDVSEIAAVGHRVVHGGEDFVASCLITDEVIAGIEACRELAPLHNPPNLLGIRTAQRLIPDTPQVAVFDTAFNQTMPRTAYVYALPYELYEQDHLRVYGFHGTSHRYVSERAAEALGRPRSEVNLITCHLGNGCSITAIRSGAAVDTSLGMTPLDGLVMGTRCGDIDPGVLLYLMREKDMTVEQVDNLLNKQSGLLGLSGVSNDLRAVREAALSGNDRAQLAIDVFCYRLRRYLGAFTAVLGRVDAVVFTGGIGENAAFIRAQTCEGLDCVGIVLDTERNDAAQGDVADVATDESPVRVFVIKTDEEAVIARDAWAIGCRETEENGPKADAGAAKETT